MKIMQQSSSDKYKCHFVIIVAPSRENYSLPRAVQQQQPLSEEEEKEEEAAGYQDWGGEIEKKEQWTKGRTEIKPEKRILDWCPKYIKTWTLKEAKHFVCNWLGLSYA